MDIEAYKQRTGRLDLDGIDFDAFRTQPLDEDVLRCLRYMHDVESHTVCYLRDLLATRAHRDPEMTTFLTLWNFEELWHGEALGMVLAASGEPSGAERIGPMRQRPLWRDQLALAAHGFGSMVVGESFLAVHMTWGAVNEWTTQAGYSRVAARAGHPVLSELLRRIMRQEGRHIDFYAAEAHRRLDGDRRAQRLTRAALKRMWGPVGSGVMPAAEVDFLVRYLFGDADGLQVARRIDRRIDALPGQAGLHLVERAVAGATTIAPCSADDDSPRASSGPWPPASTRAGRSSPASTTGFASRPAGAVPSVSASPSR